MGNRFLILFLFVIQVTINAWGQYRLTVPVNQWPELETSEMPDLSVTPGTKVILGDHLVITGGSGIYTFTWQPAGLVENIHSKTTRANVYENTTFILVVKDINGCSDTVQQIVLVEPYSGEVPEISGTKAIIYPVPAHDFINIEIKDHNPPNAIRCLIYDVNGKTVFEKSMAFNAPGKYSISLKTLNSGIYTLVIEKGESIIRRQIIVY